MMPPIVFRESPKRKCPVIAPERGNVFVQQALRRVDLHSMAVSLGAGEDNVNNILADRGA
jgi:hypothetical protein